MEKKKVKTWQKRPILLYVLTLLILLFLVTPILIVIPMSFTDSTLLKFPPEGFSLRWYEEFFSSSKWLDAAWVSIRIALGTTVLAVILGTLGALCVTKKVMRKGKSSKWIKLAMQLPMMLPAVIVAVSMYLVFGNLKIIGEVWTVVLAHTCLAIPMVVTMMSAALAGLDGSQYDAARVLGATHFQATMKVVLPLIKPSILSSCLFAFITSFDESVLVLFVTKSKTMTLPRLMFADLRYGISPALAAISTLLICITLTFFILSKVLSSMTPEARARKLQVKAEKERMRMEKKQAKQMQTTAS